MTTPWRDSNKQDEFREWVRNNKRLDSIREGLSFTNSDLWTHKYKNCTDRRGSRVVQHLMLIEYKQFGKELPFAQRDDLFIIDQMIRNNRKGQRKAGDITPRIAKCLNARGESVTVKGWGVHVLILSGACPATSEWMSWGPIIANDPRQEAKRIDSWMLEKLLRFELNPDTLEPMHDRRHHK